MAAKAAKPDEETTTAVALSGPVSLAQALEAAGDIEWADDGSKEITARFPEVKLVQGVSKIDGASKHGGEFWHADTGEFTPEFEAIPLYMTYQQAMFEDKADSPSCQSNDGVVPLPNQILWTKPLIAVRGQREPVAPPSIYQPKFCAQCPLGQFLNGERPACNRSILLMVQRADGSFAQFRISGAALKPFETVVGKHLTYKNKRVPLYTHVFTFKSHEETKGSNKWNQLDVEATPLTPEQMVQMNEMVKSMRSAMQTVVAETTFEASGNVIDGERTDWNDLPDDRGGDGWQDV